MNTRSLTAFIVALLLPLTAAAHDDPPGTSTASTSSTPASTTAEGEGSRTDEHEHEGTGADDHLDPGTREWREHPHGLVTWALWSYTWGVFSPHEAGADLRLQGAVEMRFHPWNNPNALGVLVSAAGRFPTENSLELTGEVTALLSTIHPLELHVASGFGGLVLPHDRQGPFASLYEIHFTGHGDVVPILLSELQFFPRAWSATNEDRVRLDVALGLNFKLYREVRLYLLGRASLPDVTRVREESRDHLVWEFGPEAIFEIPIPTE